LRREGDCAVLELIENSPLDVKALGALISDRDDLRLVWPEARWPFDGEQWREVLDPEEGHVSFFVHRDGGVIGHVALRRTGQDGTFSVSFLYVRPELRSRGLGQKVVGLLDDYARGKLGAGKLKLHVRTYNERALNCYSKCGFSEESREGTLITMSKTLAGGA
jgi:RimJ/RimL family protein N-acetyltransferase